MKMIKNRCNKRRSANLTRYSDKSLAHLSVQLMEITRTCMNVLHWCIVSAGCSVDLY